MRVSKIFLLILFLPIIFSACKTRKHKLKGEPGEIVQPAASISQKYSEIMGVEENQISNGRLYTFIDQWIGTPYRFGGLDKDGHLISSIASPLVFLLHDIYIILQFPWLNST